MLALYISVETSLVVLARGELPDSYQRDHAGIAHNPGSNSLVFFCFLLNITDLLR